MRDLRKRDHPDLRIIHHLPSRSPCRDTTGEPSGDRSGNLQIVLFQHDDVRVAMEAPIAKVAMEALIAKAECGDIYPRLREIIGGLS